MKIIFLDIDGVIATPQLIEDGLWGLTEGCQDILGWVLKQTGAKLVLSSSWRLNTVEETKDYMRSRGFYFCDDIIGVTIRAYHYMQKGFHLGIPRGVEIKQWLDTNIHSENGKNWNRKKPGVDFTYVILDDDSDMLLEQKDYFIKCNPAEGLTMTEANHAARILNRLNPNQ